MDCLSKIFPSIVLEEYITQEITITFPFLLPNTTFSGLFFFHKL